MIDLETTLTRIDFQTLALISGTFTWLLTAVGASFVLILKKMGSGFNSLILGFAGGVMTSASVFSLILPGLELANGDSLRWLPVTIGFILGVILIRLIDLFLPHIHPGMSDEEREGLPVRVRKSLLFFLAVTLHNIPEGLAIGVTYGVSSLESTSTSLLAAVSLSLGIGLQNIPEGLAATFPLLDAGLSRKRAFTLGMLSGIVEPIFALLGLLGTILFNFFLPYVMGFASGAMIYIVVEEIIPRSQYTRKTDTSTLGYVSGFLVMMILDVALS